jgi:hypothetical protein
LKQHSSRDFLKHCDELSIHLGRVLLITIFVVLGKVVLGVSHLVRIHEVCPERVLLVLDEGILELELGLTVLCNFVDRLLKTFRESTGNMFGVKNLEVCGHASRDRLEVAVIAATMTWRWSLSTLAPPISHVQSFSSHSRQTFDLILTSDETGHRIIRGSPITLIGFPSCNAKQHKDMGCRALTTSMVTLAGGLDTQQVYGEDLG